MSQVLGADFAVGCAVGLYVSWQVQKTDMPNLHCALVKDFLTPIGRSGIQFSVTLPVVSAVFSSSHSVLVFRNNHVISISQL